MANQTAYLDSVLRWGLDWLVKVSDNPIFLVFAPINDIYTGSSTL